MRERGENKRLKRERERERECGARSDEKAVAYFSLCVFFSERHWEAQERKGAGTQKRGPDQHVRCVYVVHHLQTLLVSTQTTPRTHDRKRNRKERKKIQAEMGRERSRQSTEKERNTGGERERERVKKNARVLSVQTILTFLACNTHRYMYRHSNPQA